MLRKLLKQKRFREIKDVQALATYELQGEFIHMSWTILYFIPLIYIYIYIYI